MDYSFLNQVIYQEDTKSQEIHEDNIFNAFLLYYNQTHQIDLEKIAKITSTSIIQVKEELSSYIVLDPFLYDQNKEENYLLNSEFIQGNIYSLYDQIKAYNQKYKGLFKRNQELIEEIIYEQDIDFNMIMELQKYFDPLFNQFLEDNRFIVHQDGYEYSMENERYKNMINNFRNRNNLYFWSNNEEDLYKEVATKLMKYFYNHKELIHQYFGYTFFYKDDLEYYIALHEKSVYIQTNTQERFKTILQCALYLYNHHMYQEIDLVVEDLYYDYFVETGRNMKLNDHIHLYSHSTYMGKSECVFYDEYFIHSSNLRKCKKVIYSFNCISHLGNLVKWIFRKEEDNLVLITNYYGLKQDHKYTMKKMRKINDIYSYRRDFAYLEQSSLSLEAIYLPHTFKSAMNEKSRREMIQYKLEAILKQISKNKLHLFYVNEPIELEEFYNYYHKNEVQYIFNGETVNSKTKIIITNQMNVYHSNIEDLYYLEIPDHLHHLYLYTSIEKQYMYIIQDSVDLLTFEDLMNEQYIMDELLNDYTIYDQFNHIFYNSITNNRFKENFEANIRYKEYLKHLTLKENTNEQKERLRYQGGSFEIYTKG